MNRLKVMIGAGLVATLFGLGTLSDHGSRSDKSLGLILFLGGVIFLAAGLAGQGIVRALRGDRDG
jgi:hypothetical protein